MKEGRINNWELCKVEFDQEAQDLQRAFNFVVGQSLPVCASTLCLVQHYPNGTFRYYSDHPTDTIYYQSFLKAARGNILICGLGIGYIVKELAKKPDVISITVIEKAVEVIQLVGKYYEKQSPKVRVFCADALKFHNMLPYDYILFDIWDTVNLGNIPDMVTLHNRWGLNSPNIHFYGEGELKQLVNYVKNRLKYEYNQYAVGPSATDHLTCCPPCDHTGKPHH
jgi:hypothetical protein